MKVNTVQLENFRCFNTIKLNLDPHMTVIVGNNATGKTAVLKGLTVGLGAYLSGMAVQNLKAPGIDLPDVRYQTIAVGDTFERQKQFPVTISVEAEFSDSGTVSWQRVRKTPKGRTTRIESQPVIEIGANYQERIRTGDDSLILPVIGYYGTERLWLQKKDGGELPGFERLSGYIDCLDGKSNEKLMLKWIAKRSWSEFQKQKTDSQLKIVRSILSEVFEKLTEIPDADFIYDPDESELVLNYKDQQGLPVSRNFSTLSDGYRELMTLSADIAWRMSLLNPQLDAPAKDVPGIIMIDEIELHLHPRWQGNILQILQTVFPKVQFVVTTHSPFIIQSVPRNQLRIFESVNSILSTEDKSRGANIDSILNDIMNVPLRPADISTKFSEVDEAISQENWDLAEHKLQELRMIVGANDPDLLAQEITLSFEKSQL